MNWNKKINNNNKSEVKNDIFIYFWGTLKQKIVLKLMTYTSCQKLIDDSKKLVLGFKEDIFIYFWHTLKQKIVLNLMTYIYQKLIEWFWHKIENYLDDFKQIVLGFKTSCL